MFYLCKYRITAHYINIICYHNLAHFKATNHVVLKSIQKIYFFGEQIKEKKTIQK